MDIISGHYNKQHLLSRIDARVKLVTALVLLAMVLTYRGFLFPVIVGTACLTVCGTLRVPLRIFIMRFCEPLFIAGVILLLKFFFSGTVPLFSLSVLGVNIVGHWDGLQEGLLIACRIIAAVSIVALVGFTTPFPEFLAGLSWLRVPKGFIDILMFAYRYIFVLADDAAVIYSAQKNRLGYSNIRRGLSSFGVLAGSLTLKAFDHSRNTTVAMMQRGYDGNMPLLRNKSFKLSEIAASALLMSAMGFLWNI